MRFWEMCSKVSEYFRVNREMKRMSKMLRMRAMTAFVGVLGFCVQNCALKIFRARSEIGGEVLCQVIKLHYWRA